MMDFTLEKYGALLDALKGYGFHSLVLRHDVDLLPQNSFRTARLEAEKGMLGVYYFRAVPDSWDEGIIREIAALGHEVGYHYESLTTCDGDIDKAYEDFCKNLASLHHSLAHAAAQSSLLDHLVLRQGGVQLGHHHVAVGVRVLAHILILFLSFYFQCHNCLVFYMVLY